MDSLIQQPRDEQGRATTIFEDMYLKMEVGIVILVVMMLTMCVMVRRLVVLPLTKCNRSIEQGVRFPVEGAAELQTWRRPIIRSIWKIRRRRCSSGTRQSMIR